MSHLETGNFQRALAIFGALENDGCHTPDLLEGLGRACRMAGRTGDAIRYFRRAIQSNPNLLTAKIVLGISLIDHGETTEGIDLLNNALVSGDTPAGLTPKTRARLARDHIRLGDTYVELGLTMEALQEYERAIRIGGDYPDVRRKMAGQYIRMRLFEPAERELKRALGRNPFYEEARAELGYLYMLSGRPDLAEEEWSRIELDGRGSGLVWAYLAKGGSNGPREEPAADGEDPRGGDRMTGGD